MLENANAGAVVIAAGVARIALTVLLAGLGVWALRRYGPRLQQHLARRMQEAGTSEDESRRRSNTLIRVLERTGVPLIGLVAALMVLAELGLALAPLLLVLGIAGLALGLGARGLVHDLVSGFVLLLENRIRVGDVASAEGISGVVEQINLRTLVLRDLEGTVHVLPNGRARVLSNRTREWAAHVFGVRVGHREDPERIMELLREVGGELRTDPEYAASILSDMELFGIEELGESAMLIQGRIKTLPGKQWAIGRELRRRVKKGFEAHDVQFAPAHGPAGPDREPGPASGTHPRVEPGA
jgi:small conductance mechanosensitive channel